MVKYVVQKFSNIFVGGKSQKRYFKTKKQAEEAASFFPNAKTIIKRVK